MTVSQSHQYHQEGAVPVVWRSRAQEAQERGRRFSKWFCCQRKISYCRHLSLVFVDHIVLVHSWGMAVCSAAGRTTLGSCPSDSLRWALGWSAAAWEADSPEWEAQNLVLHHLIPILVLLALRGRSRQWSVLRKEKKKDCSGWGYLDPGQQP